MTIAPALHAMPPSAAPGTATADVRQRVVAGLAARRRWHPVEIGFWLVALTTFFFLPGRHLVLNEVAILALFALSLDLLLGYAGIVSLGHAAFLGLGAYTAGLLAKHVTGDPLIGLAAAAGVCAVAGVVTSFLVMRGTDLTRLMVTLGVAMLLYEFANKASELTGGADGLQGIKMSPLLGLFKFDLRGTVAYGYSLGVLFVLFLLARRMMLSPFGAALTAIRDNPLRATAIGIPMRRRLVAVYTLAAVYAGIAGALLCQTTQFVSLDVLDIHRSADVLMVLVIGGTGYLYGGIIGAVVFKIAQDVISGWTPEYWHFWIGLFLVMFVLIGRERLTAWPKQLYDRIAGARP
jgi:branched-chain amino acid transport system permease protein